MLIPDEITQLRDDIAKVEVERDGWQAAGNQDRYMEACSMVQALEMQLHTLQRRKWPDRPKRGSPDGHSP